MCLGDRKKMNIDLFLKDVIDSFNSLEHIYLGDLYGTIWNHSNIKKMANLLSGKYRSELEETYLNNLDFEKLDIDDELLRELTTGYRTIKEYAIAILSESPTRFEFYIVNIRELPLAMLIAKTRVYKDIYSRECLEVIK